MQFTKHKKTKAIPKFYLLFNENYTLANRIMSNALASAPSHQPYRTVFPYDTSLSKFDTSKFDADLIRSRFQQGTQKTLPNPIKKSDYLKSMMKDLKSVTNYNIDLMTIRQNQLPQWFLLLMIAILLIVALSITLMILFSLFFIIVIIIAVGSILYFYQQWTVEVGNTIKLCL